MVRLIVDVDQHYYEPVDCCTRHLDPAFRDRSVHVAPDADGRLEWRVGDRPLAIERYPRHVTIGPGELERSLSARDRGERYVPALIDGTAPEYTDRAVRLKLLDETLLGTAQSSKSRPRRRPGTIAPYRRNTPTSSICVDQAN